MVAGLFCKDDNIRSFWPSFPRAAFLFSFFRVDDNNDNGWFSGMVSR